MQVPFDMVVKGGRWFDGTGAPSATRDIAIRDGRVVAVSSDPIPPSAAAQTIAADGKWVVPGFIDMHTHYDAEVLVAPSLGESVRHGVTTIALGNCSLSTIHASALDCADLFSRVEAVPRQHVLRALEREKTWDTAAGYVRGLEARALGPNVALMLGHSDIRAAVLGLDRSTRREITPSLAEQRRMEQLLADALDAGFVGLSTMTSTIDKMDGQRYRSRPLPSTFATAAEYAGFNRILRRADRVLQSAPNLHRPQNVFRFLLDSSGFFMRRPLRTTLLTAADGKGLGPLGVAIGPLTRLWNRMFGADLRWQHLPTAFELYADGIDFVVFEELGAGAAALHLTDEIERNALLADVEYRRWFRKNYERRGGPRLWHRDFHDAVIVACPDASVVGKTFGAIADERGIHPVDAFLDLVITHGRATRWRTTVANHRRPQLDRITADPNILIGFADSGAHLRNMAFYNAPLRLLRRVVDAHAGAHPFMTVERAVHRVTGELADWLNLDAGRLRVGDRADLAVIDPDGLDASVDAYHEAAMPVFDGLSRMVNRNDRAVVATMIAGNVVHARGGTSAGSVGLPEDGAPDRALPGSFYGGRRFAPPGADRRTGRVLRAGEPRGTVDAATLRAPSPRRDQGART